MCCVFGRSKVVRGVLGNSVGLCDRPYGIGADGDNVLGGMLLFCSLDHCQNIPHTTSNDSRSKGDSLTSLHVGIVQSGIYLPPRGNSPKRLTTHTFAVSTTP